MKTRKKSPRSLKPVDEAMQARRPDKEFVRALWLERVRRFANTEEDDSYLYLTLCGAEGLDIALLIEERIIKVTETGAITRESSEKIVVVENRPQAAAALRKKFPGLKVVDQPFANLVHGETQTRFPTGHHQDYCSARVVNLDLNCCLIGTPHGRGIKFDELLWIKKLGQLHVDARKREWTLCLTLHGEVKWDVATARHIRQFLLENFELSEKFSSDAKSLLGTSLFNLVTTSAADELLKLSRIDQQRLLMVVVPKKILELLQDQGWQVDTSENMRYGGVPNAPMVSWIMHFAEPEEHATNHKLYRSNLEKLLLAVRHVDSKGRASSEI